MAKNKRTENQMQQSLFGVDEGDSTPSQREAPRYKVGTLYVLSLDCIHRDPNQPRKYFAEESLEALASSIRSHGVRQPVLLRQNDEGKAILVAGERRWQAARIAGLKKIQALFVEGDPLSIALVENTQREDLTAMELAEALLLYKIQSNASLQDLAKIVGKAESTISEILSLNRLPDAIRDACRSNPAIPRDVLVRIARAPSQDEMSKQFAKYVNAGKAGVNRKTQTTLRQVRIPALTRRFTAYAEQFSAIDVAELKPAQRNRLKPLVQKAVDNLSALLDRLEQ